MKKTSIKTLAMVVALVVSGVWTQAPVNAAYGINRTINFQGKLVDSSGVNVPNSTPVTATFAIYDSNSSCPGGGTPVWSEVQTFTPVDGIFQVALGSQTAFGSNIDFSGDTLYLGIHINGETNEMCSGSSRIRLASVPQAFNAERFAGLSADNAQTNYFTITGGQGTPATLKVGGDITVGPVISPTSAGSLTLQSNGNNGLVMNSSGTSASAIDLNALGTVAGAAITLDTSDGGIALSAGGAANGDITISATDDFTLNGTAGSLLNIGTSAVTQTITLGAASNTDLALLDANWGITGAGVGTFASSTSIGSLTFTTGSIADSGALAITSASNNSLTLDSGTTGTINLGTGTGGKTINIGTNNTNADTINIGSALDNVSITGNLWSVTSNGILTVQTCIGCGTNPQTVRRLGANYTNATTNFTTITDGDDDDDQDLTFQTGVNQHWVFEAVVYINSTAQADMQFQVTAPSGATCDIGFENSEDAVSVGNTACGVSSGQLNADGSDNVVRVSGTIVTDGTNSGRVSVQFAQYSASGTSTAYSGSYIIAEQVNGGGETGGQAITLTGDVTGTGTGTIDTAIGTDKVVSSMILDGTIAGGDLAGNISISTTGSLTTTGSGTITSAGAISAPTSTNTINNLVINAATQTLGANSISDAGALTVRSGVNYLLTLKSADNPAGGTGGVTVTSGNAGNGTAGNVALDAGSSTTGNGQILIGTAARAQDVTIGNTTGGTISIGKSSGSDLVLSDANWGITGAGVGSLFSLTATTGNVAITSGDLTLGGTTRISNAGVGTLLSGTTLATQTFTSNNISDSGPLTIQSAAGSALTLSTGSNSVSSGAVTIKSGNSAANTAGNIVLDVGTSAVGNGSILIGTAARPQIITIGNSSGGTITVGAASGSELVLSDADWGVTGTGAGTLQSLTASSGNIAITSGALTLSGTTRISNTGVGTFISGTVLGSQTFTTNNIADSGALTIKSGAGTSALTLDSGATGAINLGTGTDGKTINIGTDNTNKDTINIGSALDDVAITGSNWSISSNGVLTVQSCIGCGTGTGSGSSMQTVRRLGADYTNSTTGFTTITNGDDDANQDLTFEMGTGETWSFEAVIYVNSPAAADMKYQVTAPANATCSIGFENSEDAENVSNAGCGTSSGILTSDSAYNVVRVNGTIVTDGSNSGRVRVQFGQFTASGTSTILAGSYIVAQPENDGGTITLTGDVSGSGSTEIVTSIGAGKVTSTMILDNTVTGSDLATDIGILTTGNLTTTGGGVVTSAGAFSGPTTTNTINGLVINNATQTMGSHAISDTGALAITTALGANALTLDSGSTGQVNLATGDYAKTINVGTGTAGNIINVGTNDTTKDNINIGSAKDDVVITAANWSITAGGVLNVQSCTGCSGAGAQTPWTSDIDADNFSLLDLGANITSRGNITIGSADNGSGTSGGVTLSTGAGTTGTGGLTLVTGNSSAGTAGNVNINVGTSALSNGSINIGTAARTQNINIGNSTGGTITIGAGSGSDLVLSDTNWGVTGGGAGTLYSLTVTNGDVAVTSGNLTLGGTTRIANNGTGTFISGTAIGSQTFTTNNIADSGALTIKSGTTNALTLDSGTTGDVNVGTGANAKTIRIGTGAVANTITIGSSSATGVSITDNNWSVSTAGAANFATLSGAGLSNCSGNNARLTWSSSTSTFGCAELATKSFVSTTAVGLAANNNTNYYVKATENKNLQANMTLASASNSIYGIVSMEVTSNTTQDQEVVARVERNTGADVSCGTGTPVGGNPGMFSTNTGVVKTSTVTFLDSPGTTSEYRYTLCSSSLSSGNMTGNVTRVRITLFELVNAADLAEVYPTRDETLVPGEVVTIDPQVANGVLRSGSAYDRNILGVVSTDPAMVIGGAGDESHGVAIALSGRVPVKVTGKYGEIKQGDALTSSPIPGTAMKAVKAGPIIGIALGDFGGEATGTVMMYVKSGQYTGSNLAEIFGDETVDDPGRLVLDRLVSDIPETDPRSPDLSGINTDRMVAGLEVITPRLTAQNIFTRVISPVGAEDLVFETDGGMLVLRTKGAPRPGIVLDASGSATFAGGITADWIRANRIEGLEVLARKYSGLEDRMASLSAGISATAVPTAFPTISPTPTLDLTVLGELIAQKGLTVSGDAAFSQRAVFKGAAIFENDVIFGRNSGGFARIRPDTDRVEIVFDKEYKEPPVVSISLAFEQMKKTNGEADNDENAKLESEVLSADYTYLVSRRTNRGFTIVLNKPAKTELVFSWTVVAVDNPMTFTSIIREDNVLGTSDISGPTPTMKPTLIPSITSEPATDSANTVTSVDSGG